MRVMAATSPGPAERILSALLIVHARRKRKRPRMNPGR
jgi:hypothetical protein